jgi:hypothetical protein
MFWVYTIEFGGTHFGNADKGGGFPGDGINIEYRWANKNRVLQLAWYRGYEGIYVINSHVRYKF